MNAKEIRDIPQDLLVRLGEEQDMTTRAELRDAINKWTYEAKRAESLNMHPNFAADYWDRVGAAKEKLSALDDELKDLQQEKLKRELTCC